MMTQLPSSIRNAIRILGLACLVSAVPATQLRARVFGYGGYGGYPGYGYGYARTRCRHRRPGLGFGHGYGFPPEATTGTGSCGVWGRPWIRPIPPPATATLGMPIPRTPAPLVSGVG